MSTEYSSSSANASGADVYKQPASATPPLKTSSSIIVTKRDDRGLLMHLLMLLLRPISRFLLRPSSLQPPGSTRLKPPRSVRRKCTVTERQVDDIWIYDLTTRATHATKEEASKGKEVCRKGRIYYFNGGAYQMLPSSEHWSLALHMATHIPRTTVSVVSYPLAPNSTAPISFPMLVKLYHTLMREADEAGETVTFAGDSAGGNFAISVPLYALSNPVQPSPLPSPVHEPGSDSSDSTHPPPPPPPGNRILAPKNILLICPSVDMRHVNPHPESATARLDPMLSTKVLEHTARTYVGEWDLSDPRVSPLLADLEPLAKFGVEVHGCTAGYDNLGPDGILLREKLEKAGVRGEWLEWDKMMHCWVLAAKFGIIPEARQGVEWIVDLLKRKA
ncbi:alpha/beta-hydrolase [Stereum hirsutum FP-91666 SS1]|uniref:alpha/beta-hydrolase n=1 Tax=Stereum hirsutum (strain FP-91666) TaxID=721885 RepID=UPI00044495AF|nr:alpha/beta-hydrolase [Stereum hirsutum FP-91666 SS1]EIM81468.1 alpha/beta-hydrolase [Stereum hirsutum FP-91666 SS1]